jgi:hypothetical protein
VARRELGFCLNESNRTQRRSSWKSTSRLKIISRSVRQRGRAWNSGYNALRE